MEPHIILLTKFLQPPEFICVPSTWCTFVETGKTKLSQRSCKPGLYERGPLILLSKKSQARVGRRICKEPATQYSYLVHCDTWTICILDKIKDACFACPCMLKILRKLDVLGTQGLSSLKKRNEKVFNIFKVLLQLKEWKPRLTSQTYIFKSKEVSHLLYSNLTLLMNNFVQLTKRKTQFLELKLTAHPSNILKR